MSGLQPISGLAPKAPNLTLLNANPTLYAAINAGNPQGEDAVFLNNMQHVMNLDQQLNSSHDLGKARATFHNLDPNIQGALKFINPTSTYQQSNPSFMDTLKQGAINTIKTPLQYLIGVASAFQKDLHMDYALSKGFVTAKTNRDAFNYITTAKSWSDAWDGHNQWSQGTDETLIKKHGSAMAALAKGIIDGKTPGQIMREHGQLDQPMADAIRAYSDYATRNDPRFNKTLTPGATAFQSAMQDYQDAQTSPGRDLTRWADDNHPPKDGGVWGAVIPILLAAPSLGGLGVGQNKEGTKWMVENPNPFSSKAYVSPSGGIDALYSVAIDPTTWLTAGTSKAVLASEKLAEQFTKTSKALGTEQAVSDIFAVPAFADRQARFVPVLNAMREARAAKDGPLMNNIFEHIASNFPEYANPPLLERLMTARPFNNSEKLTHITNLSELEQFYKMGEDTNYIISGKMMNGRYYRENHVMLERKTRKLTDGMRQFVQEVFNGPEGIKLPDYMAVSSDARKSWETWDKFFADGVDRTGLQDPKDIEVFKALGLQKKNFSTAVKNLMATHPADAMIFTENELAPKSANAFRDYARLIVGDKKQANLLTQRFLMVEPEERMTMLRSMETLYHDKIGLTSTAEGDTLSKGIIEKRFGLRGMGPVEDPGVPEHMASPNLYHHVGGTSQIMHTTEGVQLPNFNFLHKITYDTKGMYHGLSRYLSLGGLTNNIFSRTLNKTWAAFQLIPKLGIRSAVDELTMGLMVQSPQAIYDYFTRKGARLSNVVTAVTGDEHAMGLVKSFMLKQGQKMNVTKLGRALNLDIRNPAQFITAAERRAMGEPVQLEADFVLPNGKKIPATEYIDADEYYGATVHERVIARAIAKYAGKLTPEEHMYLTDFLQHNTLAMEGMVRSKIANTFADTFVDGTITKEMYGSSNLTDAAERFGRKSLGDFTNESPYRQLLDSSRTLVHYDQFFKMLSKNVWTTPWGKTLDFGELFFKYDGVGTRAATEEYVNEAMRAIGWGKERGQWVTKSFNISKDKSVTSLQADAAVKRFNGRFSIQTTALRNAGLSEAEISESIIRNALKELYTVVHGDSNAFNDKLVNFIQNKSDAAADKIAFRAQKTKEWNEFRASAGAPVKEPSAETIAKWDKIQARQMSYAGSVEKTTYSEFEALTMNHPLKGNLKTNYDFSELVDTARDAQSLFKKYGNVPWEAMDRQLTDIYRADAFHLKVIQQRKDMAANENTYVNELIKDIKRNKPEGETITANEIESARLQGRIYFNNKATDNAMNEIMKYADNPDVRTQMAWNLRVVGRFYRATEDYARRFVRALYEHPDKVIYRLGHTSQAMSGSGMTYTDPNTGGVYVLLPHDGTIVSAVAPVLGALANPLGSAIAAVTGNYSFFKQPEFNQYTLKLSMLNPSYGDGTGVPSLSGPTVAVPVEALKGLLGAVGRHYKDGHILSLSENLDNWIMGPGSDNTTWARSILPSSITNLWQTFDPEHHTTLAATAIMQAAAYLQSNNTTRMAPADWQNDAKVQEYYYRLRLQALNVVVVKAGYNSVSPLPLGTTDPGIPAELRKAGIVSFSQEYNDILRAVLDNNAKYGYQLADPTGAAVSIFAGSYPDKLVYTVSKTSNAAKLGINYTTQTKQWVMANQNLINAYPEVAYIFAPHVGKYDASVQKFMQAADLLSPANDPWIMNGNGLQAYLEQLSAVKLRAQYYDIDRNLNTLLTDPKNPERNNESYRMEKIKLAAADKANLKAQNFNLNEVLGESPVIGRSIYQQRFASLDQMVNNKKYASAAPEGQMRILQTMTGLTKQMLAVLSDANIRNQPGGLAAVQKVKEEGLANLEKISQGNDVLASAYQGFIKPLIDNLLKDTTVAMSKP